jgi:hypothetical protein
VRGAVSNDRPYRDYYYDSSSNSHGFFYDGGVFQTIDDPLASPTSSLGTTATGISGNTIVGYFNDGAINYDTHGFVYDGSSYTTIDYPMAMRTWINGISGDTIVGFYGTELAPYHAFIATPEPSTIALLLIGSLSISIVRWSRRRR